MFFIRENGHSFMQQCMFTFEGFPITFRLDLKSVDQVLDILD